MTHSLESTLFHLCDESHWSRWDVSIIRGGASGALELSANDWILRNECSAVAAWQEALPRSMPLAVPGLTLPPAGWLIAADRVVAAHQSGDRSFLIRPALGAPGLAVALELERANGELASRAAEIRRLELAQQEAAQANERWRHENAALAQALEELHTRTHELEATNREHAVNDRQKDAFIAVLAHELRNPLAPLAAGIELLSSADPAHTGHTLEVMKRQIEHLTRLVNDALDLSRARRGKIELRSERLRAADVLEHALALAAPSIEARHHMLVREHEDDDLWLDGDDVRLTQVLSNLLNNAARYTDPGGWIAVACSAHERGVLFTVKDNGRGIPRRMLPRIFDLFVQERQGDGGLGIGLAVVKHLVGLHHGRVLAKSAGPGMGSEFSVWLPLARDPAEATHSPEVCTAPCRDTPLSVALIEDDDDVRMTLAELLSQWGHAVREAPSGELGMLLIWRERPDIAFIDIGLPGMDGYELARQVRAQLGPRRPHLVALSGFDQRRDRVRARKAGFDVYLVKPANSAELQRLLGEVGRQRAAHQHSEP
jgi:signal transduction histidine kinase/ActR/RegA family two-component response regulator